MLQKPFTIEGLRPIRKGMTVSHDSKLGDKTKVTYFSLGEHTSISQESYDRVTMYVGASGSGTFLLGKEPEKVTLSPDRALLVSAGTLCGMETEEGLVYTEIILDKENVMNDIVKTNEVFTLKDLISYEEGSIANMDVVSNPTMKYVLMAFDEGTGLPRTVLPATPLFLHWKETLPSVTKAGTMNSMPANASVLRKTAFTVSLQTAVSRWLFYWC